MDTGSGVYVTRSILHANEITFVIRLLYSLKGVEEDQLFLPHVAILISFLSLGLFGGDLPFTGGQAA